MDYILKLEMTKLLIRLGHTFGIWMDGAGISHTFCKSAFRVYQTHFTANYANLTELANAANSLVNSSQCFATWRLKLLKKFITLKHHRIHLTSSLVS